MTDITRALPLEVHANACKQDFLRFIHRNGIRCVRDDLAELRKIIHRDGRVPSRLNTTHLPAHDLPARYRAELSSNALGPVKSWHTALTSTALTTLRGSSVQKGTDYYRAVYRLIRFGYGLGITRDIDPKVSKGLTLSQDEWDAALRLTRSIVRHLRRVRRFPTIRHDASLTVGGKVVSLDVDPSVEFDGVVSFMGLKRGQPVHVPVSFPAHTTRRLDEGFSLLDAVQVAVTCEGVRVRAVARAEVADRVPSGKVVGVDVGAVHPVVTSEGDIFGRDFWARVQHYDRIMARAMRGVQVRGGHKHWTDSRAYNNARRRLRAYVSNEVRRVLNRMCDAHDPDEIVIERLDKCFDAVDGVGPRMKRLLRSVGRSVFRAKIDALAQERGIKVTEVNPAYTSQGCHCGNTGGSNRPSRDVFSCRRCGRRRHADVHAATMILGRRSVHGLSREVGASSFIGGKENALAHQRELSLAWCRERNIEPESSAGAGRELRESVTSRKPPKITVGR